MVDPLSVGWVDPFSEGKKEKRRQVERWLFPFLLWLVTNRHKTHIPEFNRISANGRYIGQPKQPTDWPSGLARHR